MLVIGLMSGTSVDGIDTALVEISGTVESPQVQLLAGETYPYSPRLRETILQVCGGEKLDLEALASLDDDIAAEFARAALNIQKEAPKAQLIGSHGQTVFHRPPANERLGYTVQLGRGA
ncbi:MAG: anhydro-N-acetylmuramic acid kinase, partial [Microcystis aeruginosa Ma_AC_P_19900807_S299]